MAENKHTERLGVGLTLLIVISIILFVIWQLYEFFLKFGWLVLFIPVIIVLGWFIGYLFEVFEK